MEVLERMPEPFVHDTELAELVRAAGGMWRAVPDAPVDAVVRAAVRRGVRAMFFRGDASAAGRLPALEHVIVQDCVDITPLQALGDLVSASLTAWQGRIDGGWWPRLEHFGANEMPRGGGGIDTVIAHRGLRSLSLDGYPGTSLRPIASERLETLSLFRSRRLETLDPTDAVAASLRHLSVDRAPQLGSIADLARCSGLEVLKLEALKQVTTIDVVRDLPRLRFLGIADLKGVETLQPLTGHPSLEYVQCGPPLDLDDAPLRQLPRLRMVQGFNSVAWRRSLDGLPQSVDFADDHPVKVEWSRLVHSVG